MPAHSDITIKIITRFIEQIRKDCDSWLYISPPWFRGQPVDKDLIPKLYRKGHIVYDENYLVQHFRMKARAFGNTPPYGRIDEWLFLMQHTGLPTRLLDWTESALVALFFAFYDIEKVDHPSPVVWMLNPFELNSNKLSLGERQIPLSWYGESHDPPCPLNIKGAFENDTVGYEYPIALWPQHIHPRITAQKSCFTVHGKNKSGINILLENGYNIKKSNFLKKYPIEIELKDVKFILNELKLLGISNSTLFPDFDGLSKELKKG